MQAEKDSVTVTLHSEQALLADERDRFNFELQELQLTLEKLQQDRDRLSAELEESSGERARVSSEIEAQRTVSPESFTPPRVRVEIAKSVQMLAYNTIRSIFVVCRCRQSIDRVLSM